MLRGIRRWPVLLALMASLPLAGQAAAMASASAPGTTPITAMAQAVRTAGFAKAPSAVKGTFKAVLPLTDAAKAPQAKGAAGVVPPNCQFVVNGGFTTDGTFATVGYQGALACNTNIDMSGQAALFDDAGDLLSVGNAFSGFFHAGVSNGAAVVPEGTFVAIAFEFQAFDPNGVPWTNVPSGCTGAGTTTLNCVESTDFFLV